MTNLGFRASFREEKTADGDDPAATLARSHRSPRFQRSPAGLPDDALVDRVRAGDRAAFDELYGRHHRGLLALCRHLLGERQEAEDAVQHTFLAAYRNLADHDRTVDLKPWLYTIARHRCLDVLAKRREAPREHLEIASAAGLAEDVERREDARELVADLWRVPTEQRLALVLTELGDLSHAEVAEVLGVEAGKVKALVFQAREHLQARRFARRLPCADVQAELSVARGAATRRGPLRRHVEQCAVCGAFEQEVHRQRALLGMVLPVAPTSGLADRVVAEPDEPGRPDEPDAGAPGSGGAADPR
jgi:RNA polymerase sigma factor (sigma-70 family)